MIVAWWCSNFHIVFHRSFRRLVFALFVEKSPNIAIDKVAFFSPWLRENTNIFHSGCIWNDSKWFEIKNDRDIFHVYNIPMYIYITSAFSLRFSQPKPPPRWTCHNGPGGHRLDGGLVAKFDVATCGPSSAGGTHGRDATRETTGSRGGYGSHEWMSRDGSGWING